VLSRIRARAGRKPITTAGRRHAGEQVKTATAFLQWLSDRGTGLAGCRQSDLDAWYASRSARSADLLRPFLQWCMATQATGRFRLPPQVVRHAPPLSDRERVSHLGRVLVSRDLPLRSRVAATLMLLYAQPASRIVRLALDDVITEGDEILLRLGEPPTPVPEPAAGLLLEWIESRDSLTVAANRNSPWLFPGRKVGQPMNPTVLAAQVNDIGVPVIAGRAAAIRQHVLEMPSPVVADAFSYHPATTARLAALAGTSFSRYAPGDHERQQPPGGRS
jgi:integrase